MLADADLASLRISGVFSATKPNSLLLFLRQQMRLDVAETDNQVRIGPNTTKR